MKVYNQRFTLADGFTPLPGLTQFAGQAFVQDNSVQLSPGIAQLVYLASDQMDSREHLARAGFRLTAAVDTARFGLMVRAEILEAGSPDVIGKCYLVTIDGEGAIAIYSILASDPAPAALATCAVANFDVSQEHFLIVKVRDADNGAEVRVYLDDEISPVLSHFDRRSMRPMGFYVGFDMADTAGTETVFCDEFFAHVLKSAVIKMPQPVPELKNFGDLQYETAYRLDRAGNSQFSPEKIASYLNYVQNDVYNANHPWTWCERLYHFTTRDGIRCYELPPWIGWPQHLTDKTNARMLDKAGWHEVRMEDPGDNAGAGWPFRYSVAGWGDFGQPVIALDPIPSAECYIEMPVYAKPIPMVEDTDLPLIPPEYLEVLIYGAIMRGAEFSDAKAVWQVSSAQYARILALMRRQDIAKRDENQYLRLKNINEVKRRQGAGASALRASSLGW